MSDNFFIRAIEKKFVTLPEEELIFAARKHWLTFVVPCVILSFLIVALWSVAIMGSSLFITYITIVIPTILLLTIGILSAALRSVIEWYYHFYIITNRKIVDISYNPLTSHQVNEVLLDQVKCTEIDTKTEGIIDELMDIGHVVITFDRPTHEEELTFAYMKHPHTIETYLQDALCRCPTQNQSTQKNPDTSIQNHLVPLVLNSPFNKKKHHLVKWLHRGNYPDLEVNFGGFSL